MQANKRRVRFVAGAIGLTGLGVISTEVFNALGWFKFRLEPVLVISPMLLFFGLREIVFQNRIPRATAVQARRFSRLITWSNSILSMIGLIFLLSIPLLWWGVIKRLAQSAYQGSRFF